MLIVVETAGIAVNTKCIAIMYPNLTINLIVTIMYGGYAYIVYCSRWVLRCHCTRGSI